MNILITRIYFTLTITWSLAYSCGQQRNRQDTKCRQIDNNFDGHGNALVQHRVHRPMEHIQGFTWSHWMPPLGECLCRRIAPMVISASSMHCMRFWPYQRNHKSHMILGIILLAVLLVVQSTAIVPASGISALIHTVMLGPLFTFETT